jgi:hypothetical protein
VVAGRGDAGEVVAEAPEGRRFTDHAVRIPPTEGEAGRRKEAKGGELGRTLLEKEDDRVLEGEGVSGPGNVVDDGSTVVKRVRRPTHRTRTTPSPAGSNSSWRRETILLSTSGAARDSPGRTSVSWSCSAWRAA